jgi:hypothetical protein
MFVIMKWRPSKSEEHLYISNYFLEYCDGILPTAKASVNAWAGVLLGLKPLALRARTCFKPNKALLLVF